MKYSRIKGYMVPITIVVLVLIALSVALADRLVITTANLSEVREVTGPAQRSGAAAPPMDVSLDARKDKFRGAYKSMRERNRIFPAAAAAQALVAYRLKTPQSELMGKVSEVIVHTDDPTVTERGSYRVVQILGDPGSRTYVESMPLTEPIDFRREVANQPNHPQTPDPNFDYQYEFVTIDGHDGNVVGPGYNTNTLGSDGPRAGSVSWWEDGILYVIYGTEGAGGTSPDVLVEVARSMK